MKRLIIGYLAAGVAFCGLRWADLALWTDHASGLVTAGPVWARYAVLAVFAAAALVAGRAAAGSPAPLRTPPVGSRCAGPWQEPSSAWPGASWA